MREHEDLCMCFHVSRHKVQQYIRAEKPKVASQLSECYGAGTGCGWCRPYLERLMEEANPESVSLPDSDTYAQQRSDYRDKLS